MDEKSNSVSIYVYCSDFVLKYPFISSRESTASYAHIESLPFMCFSTFANRLSKSFVKNLKPCSSERRPKCLSTIHSADNNCSANQHEILHDVAVEAIASVSDYESAICTKDLKFAIPVAIVSFEGDSRATVCYCSPSDFGALTKRLAEKCSYSLKQVVKESVFNPQGCYFRAFFRSLSVQPSTRSENDSAVHSTFSSISSRFNLHLEYRQQFVFNSRVDHVLIPESGHGFARFSNLNSPVYGCIIGACNEGSIIPIFVTSRRVADFVITRLSRILAEFDAPAPQKLWIGFEGLRMVSGNLNGNFEGSVSVFVADGFTKLSPSSNQNWAADATCPSRILNVLKCHSQSVAIIDSFYIGGDQMCPKCQSSCSVVHDDSVCRQCGFHASSSPLASGYLPLYVLVSDSTSSTQTSPQIFQIRSSALSSFITQYMNHCLHWKNCNAVENLKDSQLFRDSLKGLKMRCCTLAHVCVDECVAMCERRPKWMTDTCTSENVREVLQVSIE
jgi:hypothetical protein